jgi:hypothetical protein
MSPQQVPILAFSQVRYEKWREVLQLCSYPVVGSPDAPPGVFGLRSIQMESI